MEKRIQLLEISLQDIKSIISEAVSHELKKILSLESFKKTDDGITLLSREQVCNLLQIDPSTLWHWQNKGKVKAYGIGNRKYYKKHEILESLTPLNKAS